MHLNISAELDESMLDAIGILPQRKQHKKLLLVLFHDDPILQFFDSVSINSMCRSFPLMLLSGFIIIIIGTSEHYWAHLKLTIWWKKVHVCLAFPFFNWSLLFQIYIAIYWFLSAYHIKHDFGHCSKFNLKAFIYELMIYFLVCNLAHIYDIWRFISVYTGWLQHLVNFNEINFDAVVGIEPMTLG